jgi:hypothetical protein
MPNELETRRLGQKEALEEEDKRSDEACLHFRVLVKSDCLCKARFRLRTDG